MSINKGLGSSNRTMVELKLFIMSINKGLGLNFQSYHGGIEMVEL